MIGPLLPLASSSAVPLDPSSDDARSLLRRELSKPEYYEDDLVQRLLGWLDRTVGGGIDAAASTPPLTWFAITVVVVLLVGGLGLLVARARRTATADAPRRAVLSEEGVTAAELRARAEQALAAGRHESAVVDAFRALAVRQVERGRLQDTPGATAHEVAASLAGEYPHQRSRVDTSAAIFDAVLYGDRAATREQGAAVLALDDELQGVR